jgi:hypothetical protein
MKATSFINKSLCSKFEKELREWAELGGFEAYPSSGENSDDDYRFEDFTLSAEQCDHAAEQFSIAREEGGNYFSNIIAYPHFSANEIEAVLSVI